MANVNRLMESQELLRQSVAESIGLYMAKEPKIGDQWRDQQWWEVWQHLKHEIGEVERSKTIDRQFHNCLDLTGQAAICASWLRLKANMRRV